TGSGVGGRVTKHDILGYIEEGRPEVPFKPDAAPSELRAPLIARPTGVDRVEKMSVMRRKIAEHMVLSTRTSAHVYSVFHVNFSEIAKLRQQKKAEYEAVGAKLTYMAFIALVVVEAL